MNSSQKILSFDIKYFKIIKYLTFNFIDFLIILNNFIYNTKKWRESTYVRKKHMILFKKKQIWFWNPGKEISLRFYLK